MEPFLQAETLVIELLLIVSLVAVAAQRLRVPYTVALAVAGLLITLQSPRSALLDLRRDGIVSEDVFKELTTEVDAALDQRAKPPSP